MVKYDGENICMMYVTWANGYTDCQINTIYFYVYIYPSSKQQQIRCSSNETHQRVDKASEQITFIGTRKK